jgi:predicted transcriptional regulator
VPDQPATPIRTVRIPDELWEAAQRKASDNDETVSDVIRRALERYVRE